MGKVIIAIHGLGNKPAADVMQKWWWKSISEGLQNHTKNIYQIPTFKVVYWADVLYDQPKDEKCTDPENPLYLEDPYEPEVFPQIIKDHTFRQKIMDAIVFEVNKIFLNDDYSLNFSSVNDLIMAKYFKDLSAYYSNGLSNNHQPIRETLRNRLKSVLVEHKNDDILLIAHSMGSIIAFDVLSVFSCEVQVDTLITIGSPLGFPAVISKIANELNLKNRSTHKLEVPSSIKNSWFNFSDLEDRVAFNYKLDDDISEGLNRVKVIDYIVNNNYTIRGKHNPHKSYGYLRTPEVAKEIYDFLTMESLSFYFKIWYYIRTIITNGKMAGKKLIIKKL